MGECDGEIDGEIKNPFSFKATLSVGKELLCSGQGTGRVRLLLVWAPGKASCQKKGQFCFSQGVGHGWVGREMRERARECTWERTYALCFWMWSKKPSRTGLRTGGRRRWLQAEAKEEKPQGRCCFLPIKKEPCPKTLILKTAGVPTPSPEPTEPPALPVTRGKRQFPLRGGKCPSLGMLCGRLCPAGASLLWSMESYSTQSQSCGPSWQVPRCEHHPTESSGLTGRGHHSISSTA